MTRHRQTVNTRRIHVTLPAELVDAIDQAAEQANKTRSWVVASYLPDWPARPEEQ